MKWTEIIGSIRYIAWIASFVWRLRLRTLRWPWPIAMPLNFLRALTMDIDLSLIHLTVGTHNVYVTWEFVGKGTLLLIRVNYSYGIWIIMQLFPNSACDADCECGGGSATSARRRGSGDTRCARASDCAVFVSRGARRPSAEPHHSSSNPPMQYSEPEI